MIPERPRKTFADYLVIGVSPVLIMLLVGSLSFFLIQVFYRGPMIASLRWVLFWFVIAIVLVARIGIEQGTGHAMVYGLGLAMVTWLYLARTNPAYLLGVVLLGTAWWCAHKLTWNCTLIDEDDDASGKGVLDAFWPGWKTSREKKTPPPAKPSPAKATGGNNTTKRRKRSAAPPGLWVVYFSLAALPLFGIGQVLLPANDVASRRFGFVLAVIYLIAALGLLLTTSFLGLRRYLRQRYLRMPGNMAVGWIRLGTGVALTVVAVALLLPRPGAGYTWKTVGRRVNLELHRASEYAARFNPHGQGPGKAGNEAGAKSNPTHRVAGKQDAHPKTQPAETGRKQTPSSQGQSQRQGQTSERSSSAASSAAAKMYHWFRNLLIVAAAVFIGWLLIRHRFGILQVIRAFIEAVRQFFKSLTGLRLPRRMKQVAGTERSPVKPRPFASFQNPFLTGLDQVWPPEQVILYTYEALQAWAEEQGTQFQPQQTPREFCLGLTEKLPEAGIELQELSSLYAHTAYGNRRFDRSELDPLKQLWQRLVPG